MSTGDTAPGGVSPASDPGPTGGSADGGAEPDPGWRLSRRDLLWLGGAAALATAGLAAVDFHRQRGGDGPHYAGNTTGQVDRIPSMCQLCTTACGIIGHVRDGRLVSVTGNPADPNSRGAVCAKGVAGPSILYDPHRLLYPMRRVGARGEGRWRRISWDEAYREIADRLRPLREQGRPEEFFFQQGRNRSGDIVGRFLNAYGTPSHFNHRGLCSAGRRSAIVSTIGESDWDLGDYEHSNYILNFGSNWAEAHQGHIPVAIRMMRAREHHQAKIVTFEARLSNTAAISDEWHCVKPGTDGLIALAMSNVICAEGLWDKPWFDRWSNYAADDYAAHVAQYTPEYAEEQSGVPAADIRRIAREFARAAPYCTTICNRGSSAHRNGFYNDRAITVLNALVGNVGHPGGWCWHPNASWDRAQLPEPGPVPPKPTRRSIIAEAADWPLANAWARMRVASIVYPWIKEGRQKASVLMTYNADQAWSFPDSALVRQVLADEDLIPFHVCIDVMYSETADLADLILPWTTYLERWDIDARPPQSLVDYVGLRQPLVPPRGESKDIREIFPELARRIGGGMEEYFPWRSTEEYLAEYFAPVPGGLEYMRTHGVWQDPGKEPRYLPHERRLSDEELVGTTTDPGTGMILRETDGGDPEPVGIMIDGVPRYGFPTPSRRLEVFNTFITERGDAAGVAVNPLPVYEPIPDHQQELADDELIMISFKWNVHNGHRSGQSKWLQEIVHANPAWLNPATADRLGLGEGDWIDVVARRPRDRLVPGADGSSIGSVRTRVHLTEGVHPQVIAISHNAGRTRGGPVATNGIDQTVQPGHDPDRDPDREHRWWDGRSSVAQNEIMPVYPEPVSGQQAYHDTIVRVRRV